MERSLSIQKGGLGASAQKKIYIVLSLLMAIFHCMMYCATTLCLEDLWFLAASTGEPGSWEYFITTIANCIDHLNWDTGRICSTFASPFLALFPKWVYGVVTSAMIAYIYVTGVRLAKVEWISPASVLWMFIVSLVVPWMDNMYTIMFSIPYVWGIFFGFLLLKFYMDDSPALDKSFFALIGLLLLSILTGWWHEGLSAPLIIALIVYQFAEKKKPSKSRMVIIAGLILGLIALISMPAFWKMTNDRTSNIMKSVWWETLAHAIAYNIVSYVYILCFAILCVMKRTREKLKASKKLFNFQIALCVFGILSTAVYLRYYNGPRTGMISQFFCGLGLMSLFKSLNIRYKQKTSLVLLLLVFVISATSFLWAFVVQLKLSKEIDYVNAAARKTEIETGRKTVYFDPTPIQIGVDLLKPSYQVLNTKFGLQGVDLFPSVLQGYDVGDVANKKCSDSRLQIFKNKVIYLGKMPEERVDIILIDVDGNETYTRTRFKEFITDKGDTVCYVLPHTQAMGAKEIITDVRLVK